MDKIFHNAIRTMLMVVVGSLSEHLRSLLIEGAYKFYDYAKNTDTTKVDDVFAKLLLEVLDLDVPEA